MVVRHPSADRLGRVRFADSLARQIWTMTEPSEGYVFGLEGEWGAGKSSVMNMILHRLLHLELEEYSRCAIFHGDADKVYTQTVLDDLAMRFERIAEFSHLPDHLNYVHPDHFRRQITAEAAGNKDLERQLYRYFRLRLRSHNDPKCLVVHFRPWLIPDTAALSTVFITELVKAIGSKFGTDVEQAFADYSQIIEKLAPLAGAAAQAVLPGSDGVVRAFLSSILRKRPQSLEEGKNALEASLRKLKGRRIVVVIDDLDRLNPKEATEMVGLVKSLGNLPHVIYLMSYEPQILANHIHTTLQVDGDSYLEKIIQYRRRLPLLSGDSLAAMLSASIEPLLEDSTHTVIDGLREAMDRVGWRYIKTPRDALRCGQWINRSYEWLRNQTDPVDLFILEIVQSKDPPLYTWIRSNLQLLCAGRSATPDAISQSLKADRVEATVVRRAALSVLFPAAAQEFKEIGPSGQDARIRKRLHIRDFADGYFEASETQVYLSKDRVRELLQSDSPEDELASLLIETERQKYGALARAAFLEDLKEYYAERKITTGWIVALNSISSRLIGLEDRSGTSPFARTNEDRLVSIFVAGFNRLGVAERCNGLVSCFRMADDISLASAAFLRMYNSLQENQQAYETLVDASLSEIKAAAFSGNLFKSASPKSIVMIWTLLSGEYEPTEAINSAIKLGVSFSGVAKSVLSGISSTDGDYYVIGTWLSERWDRVAMESWASSIADSGNEYDRLWAVRLLDALRRAVEEQSEAMEVDGGYG
ncbi:KAP family P-loop NTPase fold protein [Rhizobium rhizophilum]|uniref:KAP NTPase domain-containing protein n=1 Tax=Rhizobium rhizophilum TaxID=1850373 RepID=A0ABY2QUY5_9HYPH|nr:P-loop NTPase fold protein [Rhizobium rhizophilum]THV14133.1 hypothetical protein E9677_14725 [Rhizobium rhizophilum]